MRAFIRRLIWRRHWRKKQDAAKPSRYYGDGGTIHGNTDLDVETSDGKVVVVWFRCQPLPFRQVDVGWHRAKEMRLMYARGDVVALTGVEVLDLE